MHHQHQSTGRHSQSSEHDMRFITQWRPSGVSQGTKIKYLRTVPANTVSREKVSFVTANADSQAPDRCRATNLLSLSTVITTLRRSSSSVHREAPSTTHCRCSPVSYIYSCQHHTDADPRAPLHRSSACIAVYHYPTLLFVDRSYRRRPSGERSWRAVTGRQLQHTIPISEPVSSVQPGEAYLRRVVVRAIILTLLDAEQALPFLEPRIPWCRSQSLGTRPG
jgi:hypothetical protein